MENKIVKTIELENGQTLVISDLSRKIGADAFVVIMKAVIEVDIEPTLFSKAREKEFEDIRDLIGDKAVYEYTAERNFIMDHEKDDVFDALVNTFMKNLGPYVGKAVFPEKFILKTYRDKLKQKERCR